MKLKNVFFANLSIALLILFCSTTYADAAINVGGSGITSVSSQAETPLLLAKGKAHKKNARPSTADQHQKGLTAKQNAQINKLFKEAKKRDSKLDKGKFIKSLKQQGVI